MTTIIQENKFEYKRETFAGLSGQKITAELNKLGKDGWELVSVVPTDNTYTRLTYFFKRNIKEMIL